MNMIRKKWKKALAVLLAAAAVLGCSQGTVKAEDPEEEAKKAYELPVQSDETKEWPQGPKVYGQSAILIDADTGAILYEKNMDDRHYPASITKILTALLAVENADLNVDKVLFTKESVDFLEPGDAYIAMRPGEEITLKDAMYGMLLASANEVSYAIAENVGNKLPGEGTGYVKFMVRMNERAKELGAKNTHFVNPHGLFAEDHYTTAYDMAMISKELFRYPDVLQIMQTGQYAIPPTNLEKEQRIFQQKHQMLVKISDKYYEYCVGGKTGYTDEAGNTLVTLADNGKMRLVCVEMATRGNHIYDDTKNILEYGFQNFSKQELPSSVTEKIEKEGKVSLSQNSMMQAALPNGAKAENLEWKAEKTDDGTQNVKIQLTYNGRKAGEVSGEKQEEDTGSGKTKKETKGWTFRLPDLPKLPKLGFHVDWRIAAGIGAGVLALILLIVFIVKRKSRRNSFMRHRRKRIAKERRKARRINRKIKKNRSRTRKRW